MHILWFLLATVVSGKAAEASPARVKIAVLPAKLLSGAKGAVDTTLLDEALLAAMQNVGEFRVIGRSDMDAVLGFEKQKDLLGCSDNACLAEIGAAFGVDNLVDVGVAKSKSKGQWSLTAKMIYVSSGAPEVRARLVRTVVGGADALLASLPGLMRDLAAKAGLKVKTRSEIAFAPAAVTSAPRVDSRVDSSAATGLTQINMKAERLLEAAQDAEEDADASAERKAEAWCALAEVDNNPYQEKAKQACGEWTAFLSSRKKAQEQLTKDFQTVRGYLALKRKTIEQKLAVVDAFLAVYGHRDSRAVAWVRTARQQLMDRGGLKLCPYDQTGDLGCYPVRLDQLGMTLELVGGRIRITRCDRKTACHSVGLRRGDTIVKIAGEALKSTNDFAYAFEKCKAGATLRVEVLRASGQEVFYLEKPES